MLKPDAPFLPLPFLARDIDLQERDGGVVLMRSRIPLGAVAPHLPGVLRFHAEQRGPRPWLVQRRSGEWAALSYGEAQRQIDAVTQWLLAQDLSGRAVMVLSGNSLEHAVFEMAAMQARMPYVPVTPAYALLSNDHIKLRAMVDQIDPAVLFVQSGRAFERALGALALDRRVVLQVEDPVSLPQGAVWSEVLQTPAESLVVASIAAIRRDTVAKILFTSGSTGGPKAVPITQHMLCATMAMHAANVKRGNDTPDSVLLEWLPWSHVAGGTAIFNSVIEDGGTMYLDDGRPMQGEFDKTLRNLKEVSPTRFSSVPVGFTMLADALEADEELGRNFFRQLRRLTSSGAKLPESIYQRLQQQAVRHLGYRIPFVSSYGSTETCAAATTVHWPSERSGLVGLPQLGVELKLAPLDDARYEVLVRGPSVMAGYLNRPDLKQEAFDDEGYYRMGDAVTFVDRQNPLEGLVFAGRVAEEFKLQSGIFVRVGTLRVEVINAAAPLVADAVITGADRPWVGALVWLNVKMCQDKYGKLQAAELAQDPRIRAELAQLLRAHNAQHHASSKQIRRVLILTEPASMDAGEVTDKGYVNQRAVLTRRAQWVDALYADALDAAVIQVDIQVDSERLSTEQER
jgi:feruloyl-CoA synthase